MAHQVLNFCMVVASALALWRTLTLITATESPIVVVLRFVQLPFNQINQKLKEKKKKWEYGARLPTWRPFVPLLG